MKLYNHAFISLGIVVSSEELLVSVRYCQFIQCYTTSGGAGIHAERTWKDAQIIQCYFKSCISQNGNGVGARMREPVSDESSIVAKSLCFYQCQCE